MPNPPLQALADSGLTQADISSVEMVGSSTRVPILCKMIEDFFGRPPSRTMHSKECIARGACLQCAMLSPVFKVGAGAAAGGSSRAFCAGWRCWMALHAVYACLPACLPAI
jgi:heat shock protein 4